MNKKDPRKALLIYQPLNSEKYISAMFADLDIGQGKKTKEQALKDEKLTELEMRSYLWEYKRLRKEYRSWTERTR